MKILFIQGTEKISGGEKVALDIANNLKNQFEFIFFLPQKPNDEEIQFYKGFNIFYPTKKGLMSLLGALANVIKKNEPHIIHAQGTRAAFLVKINYLFHKKREYFIYTLHGIHFSHKNFIKKYPFLIFERISNRFVDKLVCVGRDDIVLAQALKLVKKQKLILIKNGISFQNKGNIEAGDVGDTFNIKSKIIILTICRLHFQKDVETLVRAISLLKDLPIILFIVGDGPEKRNLERLTDQLGIKDKIIFWGFQKETKRFLANSDIFILSTKWEGLPVVILEAFSFKKPVIGSAVLGVTELIEDNINGFLFTPGDEIELKQKIKILIDNKDLRKKFGENGFLFAKENYNQEDMIKNYLELYKIFSD